MLSTRNILALLLACAALVAAGCGGDDEADTAPAATGTAGAEHVRADAVLYAVVDSDLESAQWQQVDQLLRKFTFRQRLIDEVRESLTDEGVDYETEVKPALGAEVAFALLELPAGSTDDAPFVALHQPKDAQRFEALLREGDPEDAPVFRKLEDGWYVIAEEQAVIDRALVAEDGDSLADSERFEDAMAEVPEDALAKLYLDGERLLRASERVGGQQGELAPGAVDRIVEQFGRPLWVSIAARAEENGVRIEGVSQAEDIKLEFESYEPVLVDEVPADVVAYLSFNNIEQPLRQFRQVLPDVLPRQLDFERQLGQVEQALGISIERDLLPLFGGEGALYLQEASPIPAGTLVLEVDDEQDAFRTVDTLATATRQLGGAPPRDVEIAGVRARELDLGQFSLFYAAFDGKLVLTSGRDGIEDLRGDGAKLADDAGFTRARDAAGMPDQVAAFLYLDLEEGIPLALDLAQLGEEEVPEDVRANLEPLRSFFTYSTSEDGGNRTEFAAFLEIE